MKYMMKLCLPACLTVIFFSCAAFPPGEPAQGGTLPPVWAIGGRAPERPRGIEPPERGEVPGTNPEIAGRPSRPQIPEHIMGRGIINPVDKAAFLLNSNPGANRDFVEALAIFYAEEAALEGVNHDIAFAQMLLETGFLAFGGLVVPEMNNFAGLGSIGPGQHGLWFPDPRTGVRAHIQHLKAYACTQPLNQALVNPRFRFVTRGSAPTIRGLTGTWAADPLYDEKIRNILERMYNFTFGVSSS